MTSILRFRPTHRPAWLPGLMLVALLWVQSLGLVHRVLHAPLEAGPSAVATATREAPSAANANGLLGHGRHDTGCLLFDHLALGEAVVAAALAPAPLDAAACEVRRPVEPAAATAGPAYQARAPPGQD